MPYCQLSFSIIAYYNAFLWFRHSGRGTNSHCNITSRSHHQEAIHFRVAENEIVIDQDHGHPDMQADTLAVELSCS